MSRKSNDYAWELKLKPTLKLTLLAMADRTNENHECFPSYKRLCEDTCLNVKTIQKNIGILLDLGLIADTGKRKGATQQVKVYVFTFKSYEKRASNMGQSKEPKNGGLKGIKEPKTPKSGCLKEPKSGCLKGTQNRVTEPPSLEPPNEPPSIAEGLKPAALKSKAEPQSAKTPKSAETWEAYKQAFKIRWQVEPARNRSVNAMLCKLVDNLGADIAPDVAAYYLKMDDQLYVRASHPVNLLIRDYQNVYVQWQNQTNLTSIDVRQVEQQTSALNAHSKVKGMIERGDL